MADLDRDLSTRLSRLADAVPVGRGRHDPVHATAVAARQSVRLAWFTPLVVLVVGALFVGLMNIGPAAPGPSAAAGPIVATDTRGAFSLTIRSAKAVYRPGDPIDVGASLAFAGPDPSIKISHGLGVNEGPLGFGVVEPVDVPGVGLIQLGGGYRLACRTSTFKRDAPIEAPYSKGGSPLLDPPEGPTLEQLQAYMSDRVLRLPAGTWHIYAIAEFAMGDCASADAESNYSLRAEITLVVADDPAATPGPPQPTPFLNKPVYGGDDIGDFTMQLKAGHSTYVVGAPIDVSAWYTFGSGIGDSITVSHFAPEMAFSISQVADDVPVVRSLVYDSTCQEVKLADGIERHVPLTDGNVLSIRALTWPPSTADALKEGILQLPIGRWRITAVVEATLGRCSAPGESRQLHASIEIDVVATLPSASQAAETEIPLATGSDGSPSPGRDGDVRDEVNDGMLSIRIFSPRASVHEGDPILIFTEYHYLGRQESVTIQHAGSPVVFHLEQVDAAAPKTITSDADGEPCTRSELSSGEEAVAFGDVPLVTGDDMTDHWLAEHLDGGKLRLPAGRWRISALLIASITRCVGIASPGLLRPSIEIEVLQESAGGIPLLTSTRPSTINDVCPVNAATGTLVRNPISGLGLVDSKGDQLPVRWPMDFSAERRPGGAVLYDGIGFQFAREGQQLDLSGSLGRDGIFAVCLPVAIALDGPTP